MKLTKYAHACVVLEEQGKKLIIDPGGFTPAFGDTTNVAALVVTHVHADHFDPQHIAAICTANPGIPIYTVSEVAAELQRPGVIVVQRGQTAQAGPFTVRFLGELHQTIHQSIPLIHNTAVLVNDSFFYPGDSFTKPERPVQVVAIPSSAPWMTVGMAMDYIAEITATQYIPTHNALLSEEGHTIMNRLLASTAEQHGARFTHLRPGESLELDS